MFPAEFKGKKIKIANLANVLQLKRYAEMMAYLMANHIKRNFVVGIYAIIEYMKVLWKSRYANGKSIGRLHLFCKKNILHGNKRIDIL